MTNDGVFKFCFLRTPQADGRQNLASARMTVNGRTVKGPFGGHNSSVDTLSETQQCSTTVESARFSPGKHENVPFRKEAQAYENDTRLSANRARTHPTVGV